MSGSASHANPSLQADELALYYYETCPFCMRVLRAMELLGVELPLRNIHREPTYRRELIEGGGRSMVPCLRIDNPDGSTTWMYESADIIDYLMRRFGADA